MKQRARSRVIDIREFGRFLWTFLSKNEFLGGWKTMSLFWIQYCPGLVLSYWFVMIWCENCFFVTYCFTNHWLWLPCLTCEVLKLQTWCRMSKCYICHCFKKCQCDLFLFVFLTKSHVIFEISCNIIFKEEKKCLQKEKGTFVCLMTSPTLGRSVV